MQRLVVKASEHLLKDMLSSAESWRTAALRLQGLGPHTLGMLLDMTHTAVRHRYPHDSFTPDSLSIWRKPGGA